MEEIKFKMLLIPLETTIKYAMQKLSETMQKILFVVDDNNTLLGTITDGDIRRGLLNGVRFNESIQTIIHKHFISIASNDPNKIHLAQQLMLTKKIEQIPILDTNGIIIDIILWTDILAPKRDDEGTQLYENQVVIMAGGKGNRLAPFTSILPKPLIPIGNKPVIEHIMERFHKKGFSNFIFTLNYKKEYIKLFLTEKKFHFNIDWAEEDEYMGTAGGLVLLKDKITDTFFITNCDSLLEIDLQEVLKWHKKQNAAITIIGSHNEVNVPFGVLELSNSRLERILEKPVYDLIVNTGVYVMEPFVLSYIPESGHMDMNTLIEDISKKEKICVYPTYGSWLDIGQWKEYKKSIEMLGGIEDV